MKLFIPILCLLFSFGCKGQTKNNISIKDEKMISQKSERPKDAFQMNMGFNDNPVWVWAKHTHNLNSDATDYNHIYGIDYWYEDESVKTLYYEEDRNLGKKDSINFSNYILKPYPGDKTLQLIGKYGDTLLLFNVLENPNFRRTFKNKDYQRVPTININGKNEKVSDYDVEIHFELKEKPFYEVTIINNEGIDKYIYKSSCPLKDEFAVSYYDLTNDRIYLLDKDCYLEKVDL